MKACVPGLWGRAVAVGLLLIGRAQGLGWERIAAALDPRQGGLMLYGLLLMGLAPMLGAGLRGPRRG